MSIATKIAAGWRQVINSTNGTINIITAFALALAASLNFPEHAVEGLIAAVVPVLAAVREWLKDGIKFRFNGNVYAYLASALVLVAPWLSDFVAALQPIVDALLAGNFGAIWTALIPLVNVLLYLFREKPWEQPLPPEPAPDRIPAPADPRHRPGRAPADPDLGLKK